MLPRVHQAGQWEPAANGVIVDRLSVIHAKQSR